MVVGTRPREGCCASQPEPIAQPKPIGPKPFPGVSRLFLLQGFSIPLLSAARPWKPFEGGPSTLHPVMQYAVRTFANFRITSFVDRYVEPDPTEI